MDCRVGYLALVYLNQWISKPFPSTYIYMHIYREEAESVRRRMRTERAAARAAEEVVPLEALGTCMLCVCCVQGAC